MFDYNTILNELRLEDVCTIVFAKADGTKRTMSATLNFDNIPKEFHPKSIGDGNISEANAGQVLDLIKCYDVEAKGWRSFKVSTVDSFLTSSL